LENEIELEGIEDNRRWRTATLQKNNFGTDRDGSINNIDPFVGCRDKKEIPSGTLQCRHVLNSAESAIRPSGIPVPVNENDHQTGNQKKSEGRSSESAPVSVHSAANHMPEEAA